MRLSVPPCRGFTLLELLISLAIAGLLLLLAAPLYITWIADTKIMSAAESIAAGLRIAANEALKRNTSVEFVLDPTTNSGGWTVQPPGGGAPYQVGRFNEGVDGVVFAPFPAGNNTVTFTGLGLVAASNLDASQPLESVDVSVALSGTRPLRVLVPVSTSVTARRSGIKVCDPAWPATDPKGCPNVGG